MPHPPPGGLPNPRIKPTFPPFQADSLLSEPPEKPKNTGVGSLSLLQGNFPTQESKPGLLHCRQILYQLSYLIYIYLQLTCKIGISIFSILRNVIELNILKVISKETTWNNRSRLVITREKRFEVDSNLNLECSNPQLHSFFRQ